jgi:hypothetical protein
MTRNESINYLKKLCCLQSDNYLFNNQVLEECIGRLDEIGFFSDKNSLGNIQFINTFNETNVKNHFNKILRNYK